MYCKNTKLFITKLFRHCNYGKRATKKPLTAVSGFFVSINIRIDYPKLSYIILLPLIFNELRLSGDGIARKRRFGPTPVDHFVDANEMVYRLASHFLPDLVLSQMIMPVAMTDKKKNANASSTISMCFSLFATAYCFCASTPCLALS